MLLFQKINQYIFIVFDGKFIATVKTHEHKTDNKHIKILKNEIIILKA